MNISDRSKTIELSLTRQLFNMARQYDDVIDLTLGDPDVQPSEQIKKAACKAIMEGQTRYSANAGLPELRNAIAKSIESEYLISFDYEKEIIITVGGMEALFLTFATIVNPGDEVIIQAPYYVNYVQMIRMCGGVPVIINTSQENNFQLKAKEVEAKITDKTVAIVLNSPSNPSGTVLSADVLDELTKIAVMNDLLVVSDEVYHTLLYDGRKHESILFRTGMRERTILIDSISKRFAMTGYRVGFAAGPAEIIQAMIKMQENVCACAPLPSQHAAIEAYTNCLNQTHILKVFERRRNLLVNGINSIDGLCCNKPEGTFYLFVNIRSTGLDCIDFAYKLLDEQKVAVVPAVAYGESYKDYVRLAFTLDEDRLMEAVERIGCFVRNRQKYQGTEK
jgi:aminotransferase